VNQTLSILEIKLDDRFFFFFSWEWSKPFTVEQKVSGSKTEIKDSVLASILFSY